MIMKYYVGMSFTGLGRSAQWCEVKGIRSSRGLRFNAYNISEEEAKERIEAQGLTLALHSHEDGDIYDTPDRAFFDEFRGQGQRELKFIDPPHFEHRRRRGERDAMLDRERLLY